jgi:hypothetical protein
MHGTTPTGTNAAFLQLEDIGEYKFTLTVGGATREFSVVVNSFPTLKLSAAYRGTTADEDVAATTKENVYNGYVQLPLGVSKLHVDFEGVNTSKVKYVKFVDATSNSDPSLPTITETGTDLTNLELKFTSGIARKIIPIRNPGTQLGVQSVKAFLYDGDKVNIGYAKFAYIVNELLPEVTVTTASASAGFDSGKTITLSVTDISSGNLTTNPITATISAKSTGGTLAQASTAILSKIAVSAPAANGTITLASVFNVTDSVAVADTVLLVAAKTYRFTYTVKDGSGNVRSIFVNLANPA